MALSSYLFTTRNCVAYQNELRPTFSCSPSNMNIFGRTHRHASAQIMNKSEFYGLSFTGIKVNRVGGFVDVLRISSQPNLRSGSLCRRKSVVSASWIAGSQIASSAFTFGTVAVLPFYAAMVVAPKSEFTKKLMANSMPYLVLGLIYACLLHKSWTPETMRLMFANQYWLPELPGIAKMFSSEMTLSSAWIHLLAVDLFAARQIYFDGLKNNLEMRHSISLCLLFCPIGVLVHFITKALTRGRGKGKAGLPRPLYKQPTRYSLAFCDQDAITELQWEHKRRLSSLYRC